MNSFTRLAIALAIPMLGGSALAAPADFVRQTKPLAPRFAYKAKGTPDPFSGERFRKVNDINSRLFSKGAKTAAAEPSVSLPASDAFDYLDAPDGSIWFFTTEYDYEEIQHEYYTERLISGFKFTIYDADLNLLGTIQDKVELLGDETRVAHLALAPVVSKKFFNFDDKYEFLVAVSCNNPDYSVSSRSYAYSLGGQKDDEGNDIPVATINGLLCDVLNASADAWSETFYLSFANDRFGDITDDMTYQEYLNSYFMDVDVYAKAGWGGGPSKVFTKSFQYTKLAGDAQSVSPFISKFANRKAYYMTHEYAENFYADQEDPMGDLSQTEGNSLILDIYELSSSGANKVQTTSIPVVKDNTEGVLFSYYSVGSLGYRDDINFDDFGTPAGQAAFVVTKWNYLVSDDDNYDNFYYVYDNEGNLITTLFEHADSALKMGDVKGHAPQYMFVSYGENDYSFHFVNMLTGEEEASFSNQVNSGAGFESITANLDRYPVGDGYQYVAEMRSPGLKDGNDIMRIAWISTDGTVDHIDEINMGKGITLAQSYISQDALSPYIFNTDAAHEYMLLVKRSLDGTSAAQEELIIGQALSADKPEGETLLTITPTAEKGALVQILPLNFDSEPALLLVFADDNDKYYQDFYTLPLTRFAGGEGTAENPYLIASVGDLREIRENLAAHYALSADFDASDLELGTLGSASQAFTGSIDGRGHTIQGLSVSDATGSALFASMSGATVKNLNLYNVSIDVVDDCSNAIFSRSAMNSRFENIHVLGLKAEAGKDADATFGGFTASMSNGSVISDCSIANARVSIPGSTSFYAVGGFAGTSRTGSSVLASAFSGSIEAGANLGGIVGEADADGVFSNLHVDADLKAKNTVGGVIGSSSRAKVSNCHVEGSISVSEAAARGGLKAGGVVGSLERYYGEAEDGQLRAEGQAPVVISGNYVNIALDVPEDAAEAAADAKSVHRIAGYTSDAMFEIDWDNTTDWENPVYYDPVPETGISDNYAHESLSPVYADAETLHNSIDGATVAAADLNGEFFSGLGFAFGDSTDAPWNEVPENSPSLYHETGAAFTESVLYAVAGSSFNANLIIASRSILEPEEVGGGFSFECSDEEVATMNGEMALDNNILTLGFDALKPGSAVITAAVLGKSASFTVNVSEPSGIGSVAQEVPAAIVYRGGELFADDATISVWSLQGVKVAEGFGSVSLRDLPAGIYVAAAVDANGNRSTVKVAVR